MSKKIRKEIIKIVLGICILILLKSVTSVALAFGIGVIAGLIIGN